MNKEEKDDDGDDDSTGAVLTGNSDRKLWGQRFTHFSTTLNDPPPPSSSSSSVAVQMCAADKLWLAHAEAAELAAELPWIRAQLKLCSARLRL